MQALKRIKSIRRLEFSLGGYSTTNYFCNYKAGKTKFAKSMYPWQLVVDSNEKTVKTSSKQLVTFTEILHQIEFLKWKKEYWTMADDGIQWEVLLVYNGNLKKKVFGSNAYPDRTGTSEFNWSDDFQMFIHALEQLIDHYGFFE